MNFCIMSGRMVKDVELRVVPGSGTAVARFTLAVNRDYKKEGEPDADFINCVAFGKTAENTANYVNKGCRVIVEGNLKTGSYENKHGQKVYTTDLMCQKVEFVDFKEKQSTNNTQPNQQANEFDSFKTIDTDDSIPF